ncbi:MAG TPA: ABC-F family ATP-binding cassette domain-containing protein [Gemmatimonadaceae bacterium]|nr:ABC-F family ATP-binding cassette domain-containing protein [Gemmatimonadaceae bacterium]
MTQLSMSQVSITFGAESLLTDVTFTVGAGERWGIIGRNGSGKTSLFRLIMGTMAPSAGTVSRASGLRLALLEQLRDFGSARTVWDAAAAPFSALITLERSLGEQAERIGALGDRVTPDDLDAYARDLERFEHEGGYTYSSRVDAVLHGLGFDPEGAREQLVETLSGGERGRVGLARQLVTPADVLLLDEPTNHLDLETSAWLEAYLRDAGETVLLISHDRAFLDGVVDHVLHLEDGRAFAYTGSYRAFVRQRDERRLTQQRAYAQQQRVIAGEEDYIRRNIAGQNSRQAKGRRTRLERMPRLSAPPTEEDVMAFRLSAAERGGDQVLVADHVCLAQGGRSLIDDFSATVRRGDVIGLVGANGAGKSSLLRASLGELELEDGTIRLGASIAPAYYRQELSQVPAGRSLLDVIGTLRPLWGRGATLSHLARFGFTGDTVQRSTDTLSGGERARLALAMLMLAHANLILLDEPTNHLDVESIETLEDALSAYDGTIILVSHDRALLRSLATRVWSLRDQRIADFEGGFADWEQAVAERTQESHAARAESKRPTREQRLEAAAREQRRTDGRASRAARRALDAAEADVMRIDARVASLTALLEDPSLYKSPSGVDRARELSAELEAAKRELDAAIGRWEAMANNN